MIINHYKTIINHDKSFIKTRPLNVPPNQCTTGTATWWLTTSFHPTGALVGWPEEIGSQCGWIGYQAEIGWHENWGDCQPNVWGWRLNFTRKCCAVYCETEGVVCLGNRISNGPLLLSNDWWLLWCLCMVLYCMFNDSQHSFDNERSLKEARVWVWFRSPIPISRVKISAMD